jgi:hypothetical protein
MDTKPISKLYTFWEFISSNKIEIPIIQRDYAQGRKEETEVRENFLNALFKAISDNKLLNLDFIYGSFLDGSFQPIDGQQRLTTLFLLNWYAAKKDNLLTDDVKSILSKFRYVTRVSTRDFCNYLVNKQIDYDFQHGEDSIIKSIKDSFWYFMSWDNDPSISAMLKTINDIHIKFRGINNLFEKLTSANCPITYYCIELKDFGLTDDLYIKMNARGKLLTSYENFKASFQKYINENKWDDNKPITDIFTFKCDTKWTDFFWKFRTNNLIDSALMAFVYTVLMVRISLKGTENISASDRNDLLVGLQQKTLKIKVDYFTEDDYRYLCRCLDVYSKASPYVLYYTLPLIVWQHIPSDSKYSIEYIIRNLETTSYTQKVLFYAQTEYLINNREFSEEYFNDWMRVIRNIVCRGDVQQGGNRQTIIRSPETFAGVINLISEIKEGSKNIYEFLRRTPIKSSFAREQMIEEREKAQIIIKHPEYKQIIFDAEDSELCKGRIEFLLYCSNYYDTKVLDSNLMEQLTYVLLLYLNGEISNIIRRCLLTIADEEGNHNYYEYWWSYSYVIGADKRCLIEKFSELEYYIYEVKTAGNKYKDYLKKLLFELINKTPQDIIDNFQRPENMPNWKYRLIKEKRLLDKYCTRKYIAIPEDNSCCYLIDGIRPRYESSYKKVD